MKLASTEPLFLGMALATTPVVSFVPPARFAVVPRSSSPVELVAGEIAPPVHVPSIPIPIPVPALEDLNPLPPQDDTFSLIGSVRELFAAPDAPDTLNRYDGVGRETGGIWRSRTLGFLPSTVVAAQQGTKWMARMEAAGNIYQQWPDFVVRLFGTKAVGNLGSKPEAHAVVKQAFNKMLSREAVGGLQAGVDGALQTLILRCKGFSESGQEVLMEEEIRAWTLVVITESIFGDYTTPKTQQASKRFLPVFVAGVSSIPVRGVPWPLNRVAALGYGRALRARRTYEKSVKTLLRQRRLDLASSSGAGKNGGFMDTFLDLQKQEQEAGGEAFYDDDFIVDNVVSILIAGSYTTAVTLSRVLQLLGSSEGKAVMDDLIAELTTSEATSGDSVHDSSCPGSSGPPTLASYPLLEAVVLEASRLHPAVSTLLRKTRKDVVYNGYLIPKGELISWDVLQGRRAESLYPEPEKFCPFRFMHGGAIKRGHGDLTTDSNPDGAAAKQPRPFMFGFGKHKCLGEELAKAEILAFLKTFLTTFDYELVEGQSFKGVMPLNGPKDKLRVILKAKDAPKDVPARCLGVQ